MSLKKYLTSKTFGFQLLLAMVIIVVLVFLLLQWLTYKTNHGQEIEVPDLSKLSEVQAAEKLEAKSLQYVILDSVDYVKEYPKRSVVVQDPVAGSKVKEGRTVYLKINSSGFTQVQMPNLIEKTYRQAVPTLKALGLVEGKITYKPYLGKDMVLEMRIDGRRVNPGDKVWKSSVVDLVLGDGKVTFEESEELRDDVQNDYE